jgi:hypothetical protein
MNLCRFVVQREFLSGEAATVHQKRIPTRIRATAREIVVSCHWKVQ